MDVECSVSNHTSIVVEKIYGLLTLALPEDIVTKSTSTVRALALDFISTRNSANSAHVPD